MSAVPVPEITLSSFQVSQAIGPCQSTLAEGGVVFSGVCTDSRLVRPGHLFFCLQGENFDGHDFILPAISSGALGVVLTDLSVSLAPLLAAYPNVCFFTVADTLQALGDLAAWWLRQRDAKVIAVTGSNGKTTTREMIRSVLSQKWKVHCNRGNLNNLIGVPLTILELKAHHQIIVLEMGMNCPGELARLAQISRPHGVVLTNIAEAHLEGLGSLDQVVEAKSEVFQGLRDHGYIVYNADDQRLANMASRAVERNKTWRSLPVSLEQESAAGIWVDDIAAGVDGMHFVLKSASLVQPVVMPLWGRHNVMNALLAATVGFCEGLSLEEISYGLATLSVPAGRLSTHVLGSGRMVIDDSYNANPASMEASLRTMGEMGGERYMVAILGDMFELGAASERLHAEVGTMVSRLQPDLLITYGSRSETLARSSVRGGMPEDAVMSFLPGEEDDLINTLHERLVADHVILVKGSRGMRMEKIVDRLLNEEVNG